MVNNKIKNKPGRVGVKRTRPTRAELKRNMYQHGFTAGVEAQMVSTTRAVQLGREEREFIRSLLKLKSAGAIHDTIRQHLG